MNQAVCTFLNVVLVSRLMFMHRDRPLTAWRCVLLIGVQVAGLMLFQFSVAWFVIATLLVAINAAGLIVEQSFEKQTPIRLASIGLTIMLAAIGLSPEVGPAFRSNVAHTVTSGMQSLALLENMTAIHWAHVNVAILGLLLVTAEANALVRLVFDLLHVHPLDTSRRAQDGDFAPANCTVQYVSDVLEVKRVSTISPSQGVGDAADEYRAGRAIGILERILIYLLVLKGHYAAIGIVLVAKGFTRFKELDERRFAEYVLIGTLLSTLVALVIGELIVLNWK